MLALHLFFLHSMNEEVTNKARELYDNLMYFPNKVLGIFNDFFGEQRVDMQGFWSFEEFLRLLSESRLSSFFSSKSAVLSSSEFRSVSKEDKAVIEDMLDNGALDNAILSDEALATYFLPIMTTAVLRNAPQGFILVHFPHVRVTNEHNRFVDINHLWVKVKIKASGAGAGYFTVNRSEYELSHMKADYMHSHVPGIPFSDFSNFEAPCLGTGPIRSTVATLAVGYDEAIWQLFCLELDKYVRVESISGVPHRYLERISTRGGTTSGETDFSMRFTAFNDYSNIFSKEDMKDFVRHLVRDKKLKFNFIGGSYGLAMSYLDYRILISNEFIRWFNLRYNLGETTSRYDDLIDGKILKECIINNGKIHYLSNNISDGGRNYYNYEGANVCTFKGKPINIHIVDNSVDTLNKTVLVNAGIAEEIAKAVLTIVNYKYGREERGEEAGIGTPAIYL
nr:MAG TPA: hypothetical protein [Crassvirales sp.]